MIVEGPIQAGPIAKKGRVVDRADLDDMKQRAASLQISDWSNNRLQSVIDLEPERSSYMLDESKLKNQTGSLGCRSNMFQSSAPNRSFGSCVNIWSSEIATPPPTGAIHAHAQRDCGPIKRVPGQMLTFGDAFCGAGGTTRGAVMAGLKIKWGFDFWDNACTTWKANFTEATCYCVSSDEFVSMAQNPRGDDLDEIKVDILHLSPPCQYFSPAHTVNGVDDEMNIASLYAVLEVVKVVKPRVVTLEQTFGILGARCRWYFSSVIHMFALLRFSVRWAIVPLSTWVCIEPQLPASISLIIV
jgi:DNA (cytosine-5)-methyltransferase 1